MKIKNLEIITEAKKSLTSSNINFVNSTEDQFPYIESAISILDSNFNWWKLNYKQLESDLIKAFEKSVDKNFENSEVEVQTKFIIYNGIDDVVKDVKWTGPAIEYAFINADPKTVSGVKKEIGNLYDGHKVIIEGNKVIVMFE